MPRSNDYSGLKNTILRALQKAHSGEHNRRMSELTPDDLDRMSDFVTFMEEMHAHACISLLTMTTHMEARGRAPENISKEMYDNCIQDFANLLHMRVHQIAGAGLLPFDPLKGKSHNEQVRDAILSELGLDLERQPRRPDPNRIDRFPGAAEKPQDDEPTAPDPDTRH